MLVARAEEMERIDEMMLGVDTIGQPMTGHEPLIG